MNNMPMGTFHLDSFGLLPGVLANLDHVYSYNVCFLSLGCSLNVSASFLGSRFMSWWGLLPEVLRELRWWSAPTSCPWGGVALVILVVGSCSCIFGFCLGAFTFNPFCRRVLASLARTWLVGLDSERAVQPNLRSRLAEYHRSG